MTTPNRDREVCEAATGGPWNEYQCSVDSVHGTIAECKPVRKGQPNINARYIAHFNPTHVRELLDERDALLRKVELAKQIFGWDAEDNQGLEVYEEYARLRDAREAKQ